jgi:hypothetical protein
MKFWGLLLLLLVVVFMIFMGFNMDMSFMNMGIGLGVRHFIGVRREGFFRIIFFLLYTSVYCFTFGLGFNLRSLSRSWYLDGQGLAKGDWIHSDGIFRALEHT